MFGGLMKSTSVFAVAAIAGLAFGGVSAKAADLGGDCCADLEERVAELEATTARKGNRKVSLTVYGQVTSAVMFWDADGDGNGVDESNTYVVDPQTSGTRFGFKGSAKIDSDWSAGFHIELQYQQADASLVRANNDEGVEQPEFRQAHWWLKSKTYGKVRVGQADMAASGIAEISVANELIADGMSSSQAGAAIISNDLGGPGVTNFETNRQNTVRYDTPTFAGFILSAAWGEDDIWDVALRYAGELGQFKIAGGVAYAESTDGRNGGYSLTNGFVDDDSRIEIVNGGLSVMHTPTGLFVSASAGMRDRDSYVNGEDSFWHVTGGIEQRWSSLGKTTLFGMGGEFNDKDRFSRVSDAGVTSIAVDGDAVQYYGGGLVQKIDAAAMDLFISYRHYDVTDGARPAADPDFDVVVGGGRIKF